jgi:DNA mismatch repair ATPase MutL
VDSKTSYKERKQIIQSGSFLCPLINTLLSTYYANCDDHSRDESSLGSQSTTSHHEDSQDKASYGSQNEEGDSQDSASHNSQHEDDGYQDKSSHDSQHESEISNDNVTLDSQQRTEDSQDESDDSQHELENSQGDVSRDSQSESPANPSETEDEPPNKVLIRDIGKTQLQCQICRGKNFTRLGNLKRHYNVIHFMNFVKINGSNLEAHPMTDRERAHQLITNRTERNRER